MIPLVKGPSSKDGSSTTGEGDFLKLKKLLCEVPIELKWDMRGKKC
jgi:hypothetical protein